MKTPTQILHIRDCTDALDDTIVRIKFPEVQYKGDSLLA